MRVLKYLIGILAVLIVVFVAGAYLLPREVSVARTTTIDAPASAVFPHVNSLKATEAWSPWLDRDPNVELSYEGPDQGAGAKMAWASENRNVGNGTQEIIASETDKRVATHLDFGDMGTADAEFLLVEADGKTEITWGFTTDMGNNPMGRWMGLMMDGWVGGDYEAGLAKLKTLVESQ